MKASRRQFGHLALGGLGWIFASGQARADLEQGRWPDTWLRIDASSRVVVIVPKTELGQGVHTALAMIVAEELDVPWTMVSVATAPAAPSYRTKFTSPSGDWTTQETGAGQSVSGLFDELRRAGAAARGQLEAAAALQWNVQISECAAKAGYIHHAGSGRAVEYGLVAEAASKLAPSSAPRLKPPAEYRLIGRDVPRLEARSRVEGTAVYGLDFRLPGMMYAVMSYSDDPLAGSEAWSGAKALAMPGVWGIRPLRRGVAVVADTFWRARMAADAVEWTPAPDRGVALESPADLLMGALDEVIRKTPLAGSTLQSKPFYTPFAAHVAMEPLNCTVEVASGRCRLWVGTQRQSECQSIAAALTGLKRESIEVNTLLAGGGFGRRLRGDYIREAVQVAMQVPFAVKLVWTREQEFAAGAFRPAAAGVVRAELASDGRPLGLKVTSATAMGLATGIVTAGATDLPYELPDRGAENVQVNTGVSVGHWRSIGHFHNAFFIESFLDDLAATLGVDPLDYRLGFAEPRARGVLEAVADLSRWRRKPRRTTALGLALHKISDCYAAAVAEVRRLGGGQLKVVRLCCAVDCGLAISPSGVKAQVEGGLIMGLSSALTERISFYAGRPRERNLDTYRVARISDAPSIDILLVQGSERPSGPSEIGVPLAAPAIRNAIAKLTGERLYSLPLIPQGGQ